MKKILLAAINILPILTYGQSMKIASKQIKSGLNGQVIVTRNGVNILDSLKWADISNKPNTPNLQQVTTAGNQTSLSICVSGSLNPDWSTTGHKFIQLGAGTALVTYPSVPYFGMMSNVYMASNGSDYKIASSASVKPTFGLLSDGSLSLMSGSIGSIGSITTLSEFFNVSASAMRASYLGGVGNRMLIAASDGRILAQSLPISANDATINIKNGSTTLGSFTTNQSANEDIDISSAIPATPTLQQVTTAGSTTNNAITIDKGNIASFDPILNLKQNSGQIQFKNASSTPNVFIPAILGQSIGTTYGLYLIGQGQDSYNNGAFFLSARDAAGTGLVTGGNLFQLNNYTTSYLRVDYQGVTTINNLAGTGTRMVVANNLGTLSTQVLITNNNQLTNGAGYITSSSLPTVNDATLTLAASGIATGSQTFTANSNTNKTFTVNVPATNIGGSLSGNNLVLTSSTGSGATVNLSSIIPATPTLQQVTTSGAITPDAVTLGGLKLSNITGTPANFLYADVNGLIHATTLPSGSTSIISTSGQLQRAALTGDVTAAQNSNTTTIANNAVTFSKMQTIPTVSLMGRYGSGTGTVQSITLGSGLSLNGSGVLSATATQEITNAGNFNYGYTTTPYDGFDTKGGVAHNIKELSANVNYTVTASDYTIIFSDVSSGTYTCYLPEPSQTPKGRVLVIVNPSPDYPITLFNISGNNTGSTSITSKKTVYVQNTGTRWAGISLSSIGY